MVTILPTILLAGFVLLTDFFNLNLCLELTRAFTRILATQGISSPRLSPPEVGVELDLPPKHAGASINMKTGTHPLYVFEMHLVEALKGHRVCNSVIYHWSQNVCPPLVWKQQANSWECDNVMSTFEFNFCYEQGACLFVLWNSNCSK